LGKPETIRSDIGPGFVAEMVAWITEGENIFRQTSAPYHPQSMGLIERATQTIQAILSKMSLTTRHWDLFLPLRQYSYNVMPRAILKGLCSFEIVYGYLTGDNPLDELASSISPLLQAMCGIIEENYFKRRQWYQLKQCFLFTVATLVECPESSTTSWFTMRTSSVRTVT
jgi:hypothetical protein